MAQDLACTHEARHDQDSAYKPLMTFKEVHFRLWKEVRPEDNIPVYHYVELVPRPYLDSGRDIEFLLHDLLSGLIDPAGGFLGDLLTD